MLLHQLMVGLLVLTVAQFCLVWLFLPSESVRPPAMLLAALTAVAFLGLAASTTRSSRTLLPNDENRDMRADEAHERHRQATSTNDSKLLPMTPVTD